MSTKMVDLPDEHGFFGGSDDRGQAGRGYGGRYVAETLMPLIDEIEAATLDMPEPGDGVGA